MRYRIAAGILLLFGGIAVVCVGVVFAGQALYAAFAPLTGEAWAAAIAAAILLFIPVVGIVVLSRRARRAWRFEFPPMSMPPTPDNVALAYLAGLAKDRPIVALVLAGIFGAASAILRKKD